MIFNSHVFILFFIVMIAVSRAGLSWPAKKAILIAGSYLFYAAWNPPFVLLLMLSTVVDWCVAHALERTDRRARRWGLVSISLLVNLGMLSFFKYGGFLLDNFVVTVNALGWDYHPARPDIILPVGISFYSFQTLSYTLDVYRGKIRAGDSFLDYALYVTFFPQLVAGPIMRASDFLPQCPQPRKADAHQMEWGLTLILLGLFLKIVVADSLMAPVAEQVYDAKKLPDFGTAWVGTLAFAIEIYSDFAGYSYCAIGAALCLGFHLIANFRFPYASIGFSDFWRRWHISLSTWLRDYLYIPLGGNRKGHARTYVNLMLTMLLGGLWHGASWTFVVWGGLHGAYLAAERFLKERLPESAFWDRWFVRVALGLFTFGLVCVTWVFFRAKSFDRAMVMVSAMFGHAPHATLHVGWPKVAAVTGVMLTTHWFMRGQTLEEAAGKHPYWVRIVLMAAMALAIVLLSGEDRAFIYFQF